MKRVFIGGMGRSGTTIALNALYQHGALYAVPIETKFLVEADGFYDLLQAVTTEYSTARTPIVVKRFERLMRKRVTGIELFESFIGQSRFSHELFLHYEGAVDCIVEMVLHNNFYPHRETLLKVMRQFIDYTFDFVALESDKEGWVEKTPANFWRLEFLRELYPDSYFVHLVRDPRMILASLMEKGWLSSDPILATMTFKNMISALVMKRREVLKMSRVIEIQLEMLEEGMTTVQTLNKLAAGLHLDDFSLVAIEGVISTMAKYSESRDATARTIGFNEREALMINQILLPWVVELGYSPVFPAKLLVR